MAFFNFPASFDDAVINKTVSFAKIDQNGDNSEPENGLQNPLQETPNQLGELNN
jgi:hypothetical protein